MVLLVRSKSQQRRKEMGIRKERGSCSFSLGMFAVRCFVVFLSHNVKITESDDKMI